MGDGPGYDYLASEIERKHASEINNMQARYDALGDLLRKVGFGPERKYPYDAHIPDMIRVRLEQAYELAEVWLAANEKEN